MNSMTVDAQESAAIVLNMQDEQVIVCHRQRFQLHPLTKVRANFSRHKNQDDALIQFVQFVVDAWSVCKW